MRQEVKSLANKSQLDTTLAQADQIKIKKKQKNFKR